MRECLWLASAAFFVCTLAFDAYAELIVESNTESANVEDLTYSPNAPMIGNLGILAGLKSTNDSGRLYQLEESAGQYYKLKNEYYLGLDHATTGWGLIAVAATNGASFGNPELDRYVNGDPSLILRQPTYFDNGDWNLHANFRVFFPFSATSEITRLTTYAYYFYAFRKMAHAWSLINETVPKYLDQSFYNKTDAIYYAEDTTEISKRMTRWLRLGMGQYFQREWHRRTPTGTCDEVYPFADVELQKGALLEPRLYLPIYAQYTVAGGPSNVALNNMLLEVILKISI